MQYGKSHHGKAIRHFRKCFDLDEAGLALRLGESWTGKMITELEQKRRIEEPLLEKIANIFFIPVTALSHFDKDIADGIIRLIGIVPGYLERSSILGYSPIDSMLLSFTSQELSGKKK